MTAGIRAPTVSVIMPSFNHAPFVAQAVQSVLDQSFGDFELVVTDDGSTDGTAEVLRQFKDERIRLEILDQNEGAAEASNRCLARARGEFIAMLCSDDCFLPGKLQRQVDLLRENPAIAAVLGQAHFIDDDGQPLPASRNPFANLFTTIQPDRFAWLRMFFLRGNGLCNPTAMTRRTAYRQVGHYDPSLRQLHDFDFWVRLCGVHEVHVLPEPLIAYRVLAGEQNASAPSTVVARRTAWEHSRIRARYRDIDAPTLWQAFAADIPPDIAARDLPMFVKLALMAGRLDGPQFHLFALETLQHAVERGMLGVKPADLHDLAGRAEPFRPLEGSVQETLAVITRQRDEARLQVDGLAGFIRGCIVGLTERGPDAVAAEMGQAMASFKGWT